MEFKEFWKIIKIPVYVLVGWNVLGLIIAVISYSLYTSIFSGVATWVLMAAVFGFVGYSAVKDYNLSIGGSAKAGAFAGAIVGVVGGILGVVIITAVPQVLEQVIELGVESGVARDTIESMAKIGVYLGIIIGPITNAIIGSIIAALGGLIAKKF